MNLSILRRTIMPDQNTIPTATVPMPLSKRAQELRDQHYREYADALEEADRARVDKERALAMCTQAKHMIQALQDEVNELKSRMTVYQLERDEAVAKFADLQGKLSQHLATLRAQIHNFEMPKAPLQRVADNAEAPLTIPPLPTPKEMLRQVSK